MEEWIKLAKEIGFSEAAPLETAKLEVRQDIREMCAEKGVNYLKVEDAVMTGDGYLDPEMAAGDGVHLNAAGCRAWLQYLREHHG